MKKYREWTWDNNTYTVSPPDPNNPGVQFPNPKPPTIGGIFEVYGDPNNILSASGVPNTPGQINAFIGSVAPINNDPVEFEAFQVEDCNGIQYNIDPIAANWAASSNAAVRQAIQNICPVFNENGVRSFFNTTSYPTEQIIFKEGSAHGGWAGYWLSESTNDESCDCDYYIVRFRDVGEPQHQLGIIVRSINYLQR